MWQLSQAFTSLLTSGNTVFIWKLHLGQRLARYSHIILVIHASVNQIVTSSIFNRKIIRTFAWYIIGRIGWTGLMTQHSLFVLTHLYVIFPTQQLLVSKFEYEIEAYSYCIRFP